MSEFRVYDAGELKVDHRSDIGFRVVTTAALEAFWRTSGLANHHGIYVFALQQRGPGPAVPYYVGKAGRTTFRTETLNKRNRRAFTAALIEGHGTPRIYLLSLLQRRGAINYAAIDELETLMIWIARYRNPSLINRRKVNTSPDNLMRIFALNRVVGVLNSGQGKASIIAQEFRRTMGL